MAFEYQVYLCLMLAPRLLYLRKDTPSSWRFAIGLGVAQIVLLLLTFGVSGLSLLACATVLLFTIIGGGFEKRLRLDWCRLGSLFGLALVPVLFYPSVGHFSFTLLATHAGEFWTQIAAVLFGQDRIDNSSLVSVVLALLLLANEVNIAMRGMLHAFGLVPRLNGSAGTAGRDQSATDVREYNAGRVIGILERWLMFLVVLLADDWSALGFIIAAKGLVRLEKLKDPVFAEYMLVGTLLSALFAIAVASWIP